MIKRNRQLALAPCSPAALVSFASLLFRHLDPQRAVAGKISSAGHRCVSPPRQHRLEKREGLRDYVCLHQGNGGRRLCGRRLHGQLAEERRRGVGSRRLSLFHFRDSRETSGLEFYLPSPADPNALPPAIDLEFSGYNKKPGPAPEEFQRELSAFWDAIVEHYRQVPVVYTTGDFQKQYLAAHAHRTALDS